MLSPFLQIQCWLQMQGKSSPCLPYFLPFSAEPERRESLCPTFPISLHLVLNLNVRKVFAPPSLFPYIQCRSETQRKSSPCFPYFPTFSAEPERRESLCPAFPISPHLVLALNVRKVFALPSQLPYIQCWLRTQGKSSPCFPYFLTFSAEPERRESLRAAFPITMHLVLALNVRKVFAPSSLFPYIQFWL